MQNFIEYFFNENKRFIIQKSILFLYYFLYYLSTNSTFRLQTNYYILIKSNPVLTNP